MNELVLRTISGLLYVGLIVTALLTHPLFASSVIFIFSALALLEFQKLNQHLSPFPILFLAVLFYGHYKDLLSISLLLSLLVLSAVTNTLLTLKLFSKNKKPITGGFSKVITYTYVVFSCFCILALTGPYNNFTPKYLLITYVLIWCNNSFAYFVGKTFGRRRLLEHISPKKSWEGFFGGAAFAVFAAVVLWYFFRPLPLGTLLLLGGLIPILATLGDLVESQYKRYSGVKDSGNLLPGHGGFYDRMDSIIFTAPFVWVILQTIGYVS